MLLPVAHTHGWPVATNKRPHLFSGKCNTPYEGPNLANRISRKLGVFDRKLEGSHSVFC